MKPISGFSKLSKYEKVSLLSEMYAEQSPYLKQVLMDYWLEPQKQKVFDEFSENTLSNFLSPFGVVPNMLLNDKIYTVPMVIEESSVVAAAARSANYWLSRGGFHAEVIGTTKIGQVHFLWKGDKKKLFQFFAEKKEQFLLEIIDIVQGMKVRGGGLIDLELRDKTDEGPDYFQLWATFETCDAMGANFINSCLESFAAVLRREISTYWQMINEEKDVLVIMSILSNYTPDCLVRAWVECPIAALADSSLNMSPEMFAFKMEKAAWIAKVDVNRATTHNKGIYNGIDAVILATGNDFRAVEAAGHTYAARDGKYRGLSDCSVSEGRFRFSIEVPMAVGTVGGLTRLHPMAKISLDLLGRPSAKELMMIVAATGLAQNFAALRSLTTTGIQKGHMKMHLLNILNQLEASSAEQELIKKHFEDKTVSFSAIKKHLAEIRGI